MVTVTNVYQLKFSTPSDDVVQINIPRADTALNYTQTEALAGQLVDTNAITTSKGSLVERISAVLVKTITTDINVNQ